MKRTLGAVLAGGVGSRMGGGKSCAELHGQSLIAYPLAALAEAGLEAIVCAKPGDPLPPVDAPMLREPEQPRHPLTGIVAALRAGEGRPVVAIACDLPFVTAGLIRLLANAPERLVVPTLDGRVQPLLARYEPSLLPELEAALEREEPLTHTVEALNPRLLGEEELAQFGDPHRLLFNVNDPDDLREAEVLLSQAG
ncbi:MAG: molybdenum cofactor guanylyltransferase [Solirubrobacterales bacterium]